MLDGHDSVRMAAPGSRARRASVDLGQLLSCLSLSFLSGASAALPPGAAGGLGGLPRSKPSPCGHQHGARWQETQAHVQPPGRLRAAPRGVLCTSHFSTDTHAPFGRTYGATRWRRTRSQPAGPRTPPGDSCSQPLKTDLRPRPGASRRVLCCVAQGCRPRAAAEAGGVGGARWGPHGTTC